MTAFSTPKPLPTQSSPLMFGASGYFAALQDHLESTLQLSTAWATAMSAFSSTILSQTGDQGSPGPRNTGFRGLYSVGPVASESTPTADHAFSQHPRPQETFEPRVAGGMLRWLTEPPTLQPDLFDEVVELLVDEDIKTAS